MEPKYVIGLLLQVSEHRRSLKFKLVAAQKGNVLPHVIMFQLILIFLTFQPQFYSKEGLLIGV